MHRTFLPTLAALVLSASALAAQEAADEPTPPYRLLAGGGVVVDAPFDGPAGAHASLGLDVPVSPRFSGRLEGVFSTTGRSLGVLAMATWSPSSALTFMAGGGSDFQHFRGRMGVIGAELGVFGAEPRLSVRRLLGDEARWLVGVGLEL